jgi:chemotaxis protein histidine kinase CheA
LSWFATAALALSLAGAVVTRADESTPPSQPAPAPAEKSAEKTADQPAEAKPTESKPANEQPADEKPAEPKPADAKPAESTPNEPKPAEPTKPDEAKAESPKSETPTPDSPKVETPKADLPKPADVAPATPDVGKSASTAANAAENAAKPAVDAAKQAVTATTQAVVTATAAPATPVSAPVPTPGPAAKPTGEDLNILQRAWYAQGFTHPIVVHFPIGLLTAAAIAAVGRIFYKKISPGVVYFCLVIGAAGSIASTLAGWAWAPQLKPGWDPYAGQILVNPDLKWVGLGATGAGLLAVLIAYIAVKKPIPQSVTMQLGWIAAGVGSTAALLGLFATPLPEVPVVRVADGPTSIFFLHRWGGVAVTVASVLTAVLATFAIRKPTSAHWPWQGVVVALAGVMGWVGHEGGELVYPDNFTKIMETASGDRAVQIKRMEVGAPPKAIVAVPTTPGALPVTAPVVAAGDKIDFKTQVLPIFNDKCLYCHNETEHKGGFRMHTKELALKGGDGEYPLYVAGNVSDSALFKHISGEDDEFSLMPPKKEKKPLSQDEIDVLKKWVSQGASWE